MATQPKFGFVLQQVKDVEAARRFYVDVIGLKEQRVHPTFVQFEGFAIAGDGSLSGSAEPEIYWTVDDAEVALAEFSRTAEVAMTLTEQPFGTVFAIKDPEGHQRFFIQMSANRPSQAV